MTRSKAKMKRAIKGLLARSGIMRGVASVQEKSIVILRYHSIRSPGSIRESPIPESIVHEQCDFYQQMHFIAQSFHVVPIDAVERFVSGQCDLPRFSVVITFDDGYVDNYDVAIPILEEFGFKATFYVQVMPIASRALPWFCRTFRAFAATKSKDFEDPISCQVFSLATLEQRNDARRHVNRRCAVMNWGQQLSYLSKVEGYLDVPEYRISDGDWLLTWEKIKEMRRLGHVIGAHTVSHCNLAKCDKIQAELEITESKAILEQELMETVSHFSYPNPIMQPHWNDSTSRILANSSFATAVTSDWGNVLQSDNPFTLRRIPVPSDLDEFCWQLQKAFCFTGRR